MHTDIPTQTWTILENLPPNSPVPFLDLIVYLLSKRHYNESWHSEPQTLKVESKAERSPPSTSFNTQNVAFLPRYYWMTTLPSSATNAMICFKNIIRKDGQVSSDPPPLKNPYIDLHLGWIRQSFFSELLLQVLWKYPANSIHPHNSPETAKAIQKMCSCTSMQRTMKGYHPVLDQGGEGCTCNLYIYMCVHLAPKFLPAIKGI